MSLRVRRKFKVWEYQLEVPLYSSSVKVTFTTDVGLFLKSIGRAEDAPNTAAMLVGEWADSNLHLILPKQSDIGTLVHEASHVAVNVAAAHDILPTPEHDEAFAYLLEFIVTELVKLKKEVGKQTRWR